MSSSLSNGFRAYLQLERSLSEHSVEAYLHDVALLAGYLAVPGTSLEKATAEDLQGFIREIAEAGMTTASQARIISGIRAFYKYLLTEDVVASNPAGLLESPKMKRKLPEVLTFEEIESMISVIDLTKGEGGRNKAIVETMYSCGLRVSEVTTLKISHIYPDAGFVRIVGKGDKERLVPIGTKALKYIDIY